MSATADLPPADDLRIDVLRGAADDEDLAAIIAVVGEAYTDEVATAVADDSSQRSAWSISQRSIRGPLRRDLGWSRSG